MKRKIGPSLVLKYAALFAGGVFLLWQLASFVPWHFIGEENERPARAEVLLKIHASDIAKAYRIDKKLASSPKFLSDFKDSWNQAPRVEFTPDGVRLLSAGPDGKFETSDDIQVEERISN